MSAILSEVLNRGSMPPAFASELVAWAKTAPDDIFARNDTVGTKDIYNKVFAELGPYRDLTHRKAVLLEVMRVLALFESGCKWTEGVDTSRSSATTNENAEAGAWQTSYDARRLDQSLRDLLARHGIENGHEFQVRMKSDHPLAMEFVSRMLRVNTKHNGPLYKDDERQATWPQRPNLWPPRQSIYPWLKRGAVAEFEALLQPA